SFLGAEPFSPDIAAPLYVAIVTDTGSFRFHKTDAELHRLVARLIESGADPVELYRQVYDSGTPNRVHLLGKVLSTLRTAHGGKVAYLTVTRDMFAATGTTESETENFINYTLGIDGVQIGLMFTEMKDVVKISFRSKGGIGVNLLAREFGGNGHKNAAGARVEGVALAQVIPNVLEHSQRFLST
ncbi:MAG: DHHA1 domain-containing protein, partial [Bacteroidota bacterium]